MATEAVGDSIKVVVADDHPMLRMTVVIACENDPVLEIAGQASDGETAVSLCQALKPDVLVLDLMLPRIDGFGVARRLKETANPAKILILTARDDPEALLEALRIGVEGYLDKTTAIENIAAAIHGVARGDRLFTTAQERTAVSGLGAFVRQARETSGGADSITAREQDVLELVADGLTTRQMATRLQVSQRTVESHLHNLYQKLDVSTRVAAMVKGRQLGLLKGRPGDRGEAR